MAQDPTNLLDILLLILTAVIAGFAIAGVAHAWRSWSHYRRIEKHLGRR
jgi:hypothetical protein